MGTLTIYGNHVWLAESINRKQGAIMGFAATFAVLAIVGYACAFTVPARPRLGSPSLSR